MMLKWDNSFWKYVGQWVVIGTMCLTMRWCSVLMWVGCCIPQKCSVAVYLLWLEISDNACLSMRKEKSEGVALFSYVNFVFYCKKSGTFIGMWSCNLVTQTQQTHMRPYWGFDTLPRAVIWRHRLDTKVLMPFVKVLVILLCPILCKII